MGKVNHRYKRGTGMGRPTDLWVRYRYSPAGTGTDTRPCMGMNVSTGPELGQGYGDEPVQIRV